MLSRLRSHLTYANVIASLALFIALGGGAYAAVSLPKNSVGSKQIKKSAVTGAKLATNSVTGQKVKDDSLTGADVLESSLGKVPSAANADNAGHASNADNAGHASNADNAGHASNADTATNAGHATNADSAGSAAPTGAAGGALSGSYPNPALAPIEAWHEVGAAGEPAFQSGWTNFGGGFSTLAFAKDSLGFVHLKGTLTSGTFGAPIFTLPAGYRPSQNLFAPVAAQRNAYIYTTGDVEVVQTGSNTTAGLDGISFKAG